jgi:hypothetical protein
MISRVPIKTSITDVIAVGTRSLQTALIESSNMCADELYTASVESYDVMASNRNTYGVPKCHHRSYSIPDVRCCVRDSDTRDHRSYTQVNEMLLG